MEKPGFGSDVPCRALNKRGVIVVVVVLGLHSPAATSAVVGVVVFVVATVLAHIMDDRVPL